MANTTFPPQGRGLPSRLVSTPVDMTSSASSDEGEIRDGGLEKATTTRSKPDGTSVDRQSRNRSNNSTSMSPEHNHRSRDKRSHERSRSPYSERPPRGAKRGRDDEYPDRSRDPRRFKVHYEDSNSADYKRRPRVSYDDLDRGPSASADLRYEDRDRYSDKRPRTRSRSPYRANRGGDTYGRGGQPRRDADRYGISGARGSKTQNGSHNYGDVRNRDIKDQSVSKRGNSPLPAGNARHEAKNTQGSSQRSSERNSTSFEVEK